MSITIMDTRGAEIFVRSMAGSEGLRVRFEEDEDAQPYTDPIANLIVVAMPRWYWTEHKFQCWLGAICHELGHHRGVNGELMQYFVDKRLNTRSIYGKVINILMDWVNDAQWVGYAGAHNAVEAIQKHCASKGLAMLRTNPPETEEDKLICNVFSWIYNRRALTYQKGLLASAVGWLEIIRHDYDGYNSELSELLVRPSGHAIEVLAKKIVPESMQDPEDEDTEDGDEGEGADGEQGEPSDGDGDGGDAEDDEEGDGDPKENRISYKDVLMAHDHSTMGKPSKTDIVYDHDWSKSYVPFKDYKEIDLSEVSV